MCGIVGYVGSRPCAPLLLDALKRLEYRGYDSAGLAVHDGRTVHIRRSAGKLGELEKALAASPVEGTAGIGHTRWATHGPPSTENAHPHLVGGVAVVHNGIIENHLALKRSLALEGHRFASDTDTEIIAHLIDRALGKGGNLFDAVRAAVGELRGTFSLAVVRREEPGTIVVAKNASPLILGLGEGESFCASDIPAILPYTRRMIFLEDGDIARLGRDGVRVERIDRPGEEASPRPVRTIDWSPMQAEKGGYKHFMLKEIHEQPRAVTDTLRGRIDLEAGDVVADEIGVAPAVAERVRRVVLLACGTSYYAALVGRHLIEQLARLPAVAELASEYRHRDPVVGPDDLVVAVSQSGETLDTLGALRLAKASGAHTLALVNVVGSAIARDCEGSLVTHAGPEIGVASTKCFTAQIAALVLFAVYLGRRRGALGADRARALLEQLLLVPHQMTQALSGAEALKTLAHRFARSPDFLYLGRGLSYPIALEGALKLKEISYIHAEGYAAGEMKHGPIALIDRQMPVVAVVPDDESYAKAVGNLQEARAREGILIAVTTEGSSDKDEVASLAEVVIRVPRTAPELSPLVTVLPLQLLAYYIADFKGTDVDQPRNLAKTVTVE